MKHVLIREMEAQVQLKPRGRMKYLTYVMVHGISRAFYIQRTPIYIFMACEPTVFSRTNTSVNTTCSRVSPHLELCAPLILSSTVNQMN